MANILLSMMFLITPAQAKKMGYLIFFVHSSCSYCSLELPVIMEAHRRGYNVVVIVSDSTELGYFSARLKGITVKVNEGEAQVVGVDATPTVVFYYPKGDEAHIIAKRYVTLEEIESILSEIKIVTPYIEATQTRTTSSGQQRKKIKITTPN